MPEQTRRGFLLAAVEEHGRPVSTSLAEQLLAGSPWPTARRNTARKTLRGLAREGHLTAVDIDGRRLYHPISQHTGDR